MFFRFILVEFVNMYAFIKLHVFYVLLVELGDRSWFVPFSLVLLLVEGPHERPDPILLEGLACQWIIHREYVHARLFLFRHAVPLG